MTGTRLLVFVFVLTTFLVAPAVAQDSYRYDTSPENLEKLVMLGSTVELVERAKGISAYRWKGTPGEKVGALCIHTPPRDITGYRTLRFLIRAEKPVTESLYVVFISARATLTAKIPGPGVEWKRVEIALPGMRQSADFNPRNIDRLNIGIQRPAGFTIDIDDIELTRAGAGWRLSPEEEEARQSGPRFVVSDFESAGAMARVRPNKSKKESIPTTEPRGHALRWSMAADAGHGFIDFKNVPKDLRPYRMLRFRARAPKAFKADLRIRFLSSGGLIQAKPPEIGEEWTEVEVLIPDLRLSDQFDPAAVKVLRISFLRTNGHHLDIDDVELLKEGGGWRYSTAERREYGIDSTAPVYRISDFERKNAITRLYPLNSKVELCEEKKRSKVIGHHLRWTVEGGLKDPQLTFRRSPADIRDYRVLRFRARVDKVPAGRIKVTFQCMKGSIRTYLSLKPKRWQEVEINLPQMTLHDDFNPEDVRVLRFVYYGEDDFVLDLDNVELAKDAGGWRQSEKEQLAFIFGEDRVSKVHKTETDHFLIWSDSAAARKKFERAVEKTHDFVCRELGVGEMPGQLAIYIFQSSDLYFEFCVRKGWSREEAEHTAGHAEAGYFATFYQAPATATVTHELTHSIVHRTLGTGGGSWYQEGIAVYIEQRWLKKSAAAEFAPRLRSEAYVPLAEFLAIDELVGEEDLKGGPRSRERLYAQAGAFFEFLLRGPYIDMAPDRVKALSVLNAAPSRRAMEVEEILGASLDQIELDWAAWGSAPPKARRK